MRNLVAILDSWINRNNLYVLVAYIVLGRLGLLLAIPPGYATAIFPAAGVALASVLILGPACLPAIFFGSFFLNLLVGYEVGSNLSSMTPYLLAIAIGFGSTLQADLARRLIARILPLPMKLLSARELLLFFAVAGPLACLVGASVGVTALWSASLVSSSNFFLSWLNWWVGDAIGAMVVAPMILILFSEPRNLWSRRVKTVFIPTAVALGLVAFFFASSARWEEQRVFQNFNSITDVITDDILKRTRSSVEVLNSIKTIYAVNGVLSKSQFEKMAQVYQVKYPNLLSLSWAPREVSNSNLHFRIFYFWPSQNNHYRGFDLYSEPQRRTTIDKALARNAPTFTGAVSLLNDHEKTNSGIILLTPVFLKFPQSEAAGVLAAGFKMENFFTSEFLKSFEGQYHLRILDQESVQPIYSVNNDLLSSKRAQSSLIDLRFQINREIEVAGKTFVLDFQPTSEWLAKTITWSSYAALLGGLFFCVLLLALLLSISGSATNAEELVKKRTADLNKSKERLENQNRQVDDLYTRLKTFLSVAPAGIYEADPAGRCVFVNDEWVQITGISRESAAKEGWSSAIHPEDRDMVFKEWSAAVLERRAFSLEFRFRRPDGSECWVTSRAIARLNEDQEIEGYAGAFFEIQRLKQAEANLRALNQVFENAVEGISRIDSEGRYIFVNSAFANTCGYQSEDLVGSHWTQTVLPEDLPKAQKAYEDLLVHGKSETELRGVRQDGSPFDKEVVMIAEYSRGNEMVGHHCFMRDISSRKQIENEFILAKELAEAGSRAKSEFLATVSHEIRTPLNGIVGFLDLLSETQLTSRQAHFAGSAKQSSELLLNIINDILDVSKIEAGKLELEVIDFSLGPMLDSFRSLFAEQARIKRLSFKIQNNCPQIIFLKGDMARLHQVLINLISNAIKFTQEGAVHLNVICLSEIKDSVRMRFEIVDTGLGIPESALERIFEAFTQVDSSMTRRFGGTGLGLNICKKLVDLMGGKLGVKSSLSQGSTFWVELDFVKGSLRSEARLNMQPTLGPRKQGRVLVAEDVQINQQVIAGLLEFLGVRATTVANGHEALDALRSMPYDLVLMDCEMPDLDGFEATRIIRGGNVIQNKDIPIIALTARALQGDRERCLQAGMNDYLSKPISREALDAVLQEWLPESQAKKWIDVTQLGLLSSLKDKLLVPKLFDLFVDKIPKQIEEVKKFAKEKDYLQMTRVAHSAKSASANMGAKKLSDIFAEIEAVGAGEFSKSPRESILLLDTYFEFTVKELQQHLAQTQARQFVE